MTSTADQNNGWVIRLATRGAEWTLLMTLIGASISTTGCHTGPQPIVSCPIPASEQQGEILKIAPIGTERQEVLKRLEKAGIDVSPGAARVGQNPSIYYCNLWERSDGARWQLDVALLFDSSGKLYATRGSQAETGIDRGPSFNNSTANTTGGTAPVAPAEGTNAAAEEPYGSGPRVPFTKER